MNPTDNYLIGEKMNFVAAIILGVHIISVLGMLMLLLLQANKPEKEIKNGFLHAAWTALLAGIILVSIDYEDINMGTIGFKSVVFAVIISLAYHAKGKGKLKNSTWILMIALTTLNILVASFALAK